MFYRRFHHFHDAYLIIQSLVNVKTLTIVSLNLSLTLTCSVTEKKSEKRKKPLFPFKAFNRAEFMTSENCRHRPEIPSSHDFGAVPSGSHVPHRVAPLHPLIILLIPSSHRVGPGAQTAVQVHSHFPPDQF